MKIYKVEHIYDKSLYINVEGHLLGYFSSKTGAEKTVEFFKPIKGFCDYPDGFIITELPLNCTRKPIYLYQIWYYIHDKNYDYEYGKYLDLNLYTNKKEAVKVKSRFERLNKEEIKKCPLEIESGINRWKLDEKTKEWHDGFEVYVGG